VADLCASKCIFTKVKEALCYYNKPNDRRTNNFNRNNLPRKEILGHSVLTFLYNINLSDWGQMTMSAYPGNESFKLLNIDACMQLVKTVSMRRKIDWQESMHSVNLWMRRWRTEDPEPIQAVRVIKQSLRLSYTTDGGICSNCVIFCLQIYLISGHWIS